MTEPIDYKARYEALVRLLAADEWLGIYPIGYLTAEQRAAFEGSDAYKTGWDDAALAGLKRVTEIVDAAEKGPSDDVTMLLAAGDGLAVAGEGGSIALNMNGTFYRATSWLPTASAEEVPEVARLFRLYGRAGLCYWASRHDGNARSDSDDINRAIDFVAAEEARRKAAP